MSENTEEKSPVAFDSGVLSERPPIRVGILGIGRQALDVHLPAFEALPDLFRVTAVCDLLKERRDRVVARHPHVHTYRQVNDMLDDPEVDLVDIVLPSRDHQQAALETLQRNKWAVVETPLAITHEDALVLRAASFKTRGKLIPYVESLFASDYRLAALALDDPRLDGVYDVRLRRQDYIRRDDWQSVKRCAGGAAYYAAQDALLQATVLLQAPPAQLWSELRRVASLGDAEDFAHILLKTRQGATADIEINGGTLPPFEPAFTLRGARGTFSVAAGAATGTFHVIDPDFRFPRRRSSVRTPELVDLHEQFPIVDIPLSLPPDAEVGPTAFWRSVYKTVRTAAPFPVSIDDVVETVRYLHLVKRSSPFAQ